MKPNLLILFLFLYMMSYSQNRIERDTVINKTIKVGGSFDLAFVDWPGTGYCWTLSSVCDTSLVSSKQVSSKLMKGYKECGGKYIETIQFSGIRTGQVTLDYYYGRPWLKEKLYLCRVKIKVE